MARTYTRDSRGRFASSAGRVSTGPAARGQSRLSFYGVRKDGVILQKLIKANRENPFEAYRGPASVDRNLNAAGAWLAKRNQPSMLFRGDKNTYAMANIGARGVAMNRRADFWASPRAWQAKHYNERWFSTRSPAGLLHHEIGHTKDKAGSRRRGRDAWGALLPGVKMPRPLRNRIASIGRRVSGYAGTSPMEFVAETYAGLRTGHRYDRQVMALYRDLQGPGGRARRSRRRS
jgi:hypothetical protein